MGSIDFSLFVLRRARSSLGVRRRPVFSCLNFSDRWAKFCTCRLGPWLWTAVVGVRCFLWQDRWPGRGLGVPRLAAALRHGDHDDRPPRVCEWSAKEASIARPFGAGISADGRPHRL